MNDDVFSSFLGKAGNSFLATDSEKMIALARCLLMNSTSSKKTYNLSEKLESDDAESWTAFIKTGSLDGSFKEFPLSVQDVSDLNKKYGVQPDFKYYIMKCIDSSKIKIKAFEDLLSLKKMVKNLPPNYINSLAENYIEKVWLNSDDVTISSQLREIPLRDFKIALSVIDGEFLGGEKITEFFNYAKRFVDSDVEIQKNIKLILPPSFLAEKLEIISDNKNGKLVLITENNVVSFLKTVINEIFVSDLFLAQYLAPKYSIKIEDNTSRVVVSFNVKDNLTEKYLSSIILSTIELLPDVFAKSELSDLFTIDNNAFIFSQEAVKLLKEVVMISLNKIKTLEVLNNDVSVKDEDDDFKI